MQLSEAKPTNPQLIKRITEIHRKAVGVGAEATRIASSGY